MRSVLGRILILPVVAALLLLTLFYIQFVRNGPVPIEDFLAFAFATALAFAIIILLFGYQAAHRIVRPLQSVIRLLQSSADAQDASFSRSGFYEIDEIQRQTRIYLQRMQAQLADLDLERELLRSLLNGLREGVMCIDSAGNIVFVNDRIDDSLLDADSMSSRYYSRIRNADLLDYVRRLMTARPDGENAGDAVPEDMEFRAADRYYQVRHRPVNVGKEPSMFLILVQDMTEEYNTRRIREDFLQNASHELKTPITSIRGYAETLLPRVHDETQKRFLEGIIRNAERMDRLIHDMVVISSLESRVYPFYAESVHMPAFFEELKLLVEGTLKQKQQRLHTVIDGVTEIRADRLLLEHMLVNLVSNASRYSPENSVITISLSRRDRRIDLRVCDQGPGIPEAYREKVFERFFRLDADRSRKEGGTGLGLSIVRHVARMHSGSVHIEDGPEGGACFVFLFSETGK